MKSEKAIEGKVLSMSLLKLFCEIDDFLLNLVKECSGNFLPAGKSRGSNSKLSAVRFS